VIKIRLKPFQSKWSVQKIDTRAGLGVMRFKIFSPKIVKMLAISTQNYVF
jgi:hypothetical protein